MDGSHYSISHIDVTPVAVDCVCLRILSEQSNEYTITVITIFPAIESLLRTPMIIGILTIEIDIDYASSLKDKRKLLSRIKDRVRGKFNVSIAEVDGNDVMNYACLGVVIVANDQKFANKVLNKVADLIEDVRDCVVSGFNTDYLHL